MAEQGFNILHPNLVPSGLNSLLIGNSFKLKSQTLMKAAAEAEPALGYQGKFQVFLNQFLLLAGNQKYRAESCEDDQGTEQRDQ